LGDTYPPGAIFTATSTPGHGTVSMNANGTYLYTPQAGFVGTDTFTYQIKDATGKTVTATETIVIKARPFVFRCISTIIGMK
jgi:hypothetical protein